MVTLDNGRLHAEISERGAELQALRLDGADYLWNGDPAWWTGRAPIMFPICGGLKNDEYVFEGKTYSIPKHGFVRKKDWQVESASAEKAVFLFTDTEETRAVYPFTFELRAVYTLEGTSLKVEFSVTNRGGSTMYYSVGAHEGYACPEGVEAYDLIFEQPETFRPHDLDGNIVLNSTKTLLENSDTLALHHEFFSIDALVFTDLRSRAVTLRNRSTGRSVHVDFPGFDYLFVWQKCGAPYVCIEPWRGVPDFEDADGILTHKRGIRPLEAGKTEISTHVITPGA